MTTEVERIVSPGLFLPNSSLLLDPSRARAFADPPPRLAAVTYVARRRAPSDGLDAVVAAAVQPATSAVYDAFQAQAATLFVADGPLQISSPTRKHKRLWNAHPEVKGAFDPSALGEEILFEYAGGIRYAGLVVITREHFAEVARLARRDHALAILARRDAREVDAATIFMAAFPEKDGIPASSIDWLSLCAQRCPAGDLVVRAAGGFDDPEAAIDLIVCPERFPIEHL
jgi:hypothetical protein